MAARELLYTRANAFDATGPAITLVAREIVMSLFFAPSIDTARRADRS